MVEAIKAKGRVAAIVVGNASVASFDEGVLTLRFPRQGDVKGFQGSKYEELLKQAITAMFGVNVVIRAVTGGGDAAAPARRPGLPPSPPPAPGAAPGQPPQGQAPGQPGLRPPDGAPPPDYPPGGASASAPSYFPGAGGPVPGAGAGQQAGSAGQGGGEGPHPFGSPVSGGGDLPPLPPPPAPDDDEFDPDDEDMSVPVTNQLTGMALVQRELGGQVIAEYED